jgi:ribosomal protein L11 methyltransferase
LDVNLANLSYLELSFVVDRELLSELEQSLNASLNPLSISIEDFDLDGIDEQSVYLEPSGDALHPGEYRSVMWNKNRVSVLLQPLSDEGVVGVSQEQADIYVSLVFVLLDKLWQQTGIFMPEVTHRWMSDQDWVTLTQKQFQPMSIGKKLWISPSWHEVPVEIKLNRHVIWIDPGMAFGTGGHATTHLCLEWLDSFEMAAQSVLDYGCGSGVLAIAASKLGANVVKGVDLDPKAITIAQQNSVKNGVDVNTTWWTVDAFDQAQNEAKMDKTYNVVIANILTNPLKLLADKLISLVNQNGYLVLSGVLERQADDVCLVYQHAGIHLKPVRFLEGWALLVAKK